MTEPATPVRRHTPAAVAFAGDTLDRAPHLRADAEFERVRGLDSSRAVLVGAGQDVALGPDGALVRVPLAELPADAALTFLGLETSGTAVFAYDAAGDGAAGDGAAGDGAAGDGAVPAREERFVGLRGLAAELDPPEGALAAYAVGMVGWHRVNRYCGRSGDATVVEAAGHRRRCPGCGLVVFPRTDPAITMLVTAGERCLLSRRHGAPRNRWSALAGFVEPGETLEQAVVREAREETGIDVVAVEYLATQPWPFPAALMIGFWAFADADRAGVPEPQPDELVDARWFERGELRAALSEERIAIPPPGTIGNYLITTWLAG
ncbi:MAG TPA: NAD(+) diphosphatase [Solirubrobacteraceae bacterium]|nr:NAD(+) diphosphatase [Solirubrobacteraceae bacterium]